MVWRRPVFWPVFSAWWKSLSCDNILPRSVVAQVLVFFSPLWRSFWPTTHAEPDIFGPGVATNTDIKWHRCRLRLFYATVHSSYTSRSSTATPICRLKQPRLPQKRRRSDCSCGLALRGVEYSVRPIPCPISSRNNGCIGGFAIPKICPKLQERKTPSPGGMAEGEDNYGWDAKSWTFRSRFQEGSSRSY